MRNSRNTFQGDNTHKKTVDNKSTVYLACTFSYSEEDTYYDGEPVYDIWDLNDIRQTLYFQQLQNIDIDIHVLIQEEIEIFWYIYNL